MFGIEALDVVIGLIFVYLLFSLFVSIVNEMISSILNSRGKKLFNSLKELIGEKGVEAFYNDPRIKVLTRSGSVISSVKTEFKELKNKRLPGYIPDKTAGEIIAEIDNEKLGGFLGSVDDLAKNSRDKMIEIFELSLLETRETYKKYIRNLTLFIGLIVTISFNVDSISIFKQLSNDPEKAALVARFAEEYVALNDSLKTDLSDSTVSEIKLELNKLYKSNIKSVDATLGLGWNSNTKISDQISALTALGWIITTLALSLGAPFWFDLLKKIINVKTEITKKDATPTHTSST